MSYRLNASVLAFALIAFGCGGDGTDQDINSILDGGGGTPGAGATPGGGTPGGGGTTGASTTPGGMPGTSPTPGGMPGTGTTPGGMPGTGTTPGGMPGTGSTPGGTPGAGNTDAGAGATDSGSGSSDSGGGTTGGNIDAGTGGTTGGGTPGGGTPGGGGSIIRGPMPTEQSILKNGPCAPMTFTSGFARASGVDSSTVHYPTASSDECKPPWGGVAVVPGFVSPESSIREWGPFLASHGIVTVTIGVPGGDQPGQRATKLMGTLESLKKENTRSGSPLMGKLDLTRLGVSGWSMGGGGTLISAAANPTLKAAVSFAAWGPSGARNNKVPVLMFEATADILAAGMSDGYFRDTPATTPKMLFEVQGSSHNVANSPKNHSNIIGAYGLSWWKVYLEGDERYKQFLTRPFPSLTTAKSAHNLK